MPEIRELQVAQEGAEPVVPGPSGSRVTVRVAAWFGLVVGGLELAAWLTQRALISRVSMESLRTNRHFFWMVPLANLLIFSAVGLLIVGLGRYRPKLARWLGWRLLLFLAALAVLLTIDGLALTACLALAGGIGACFGARCDRATERIDRLARLSLPVLAVGLLVTSVIAIARAVTAERRAWAQLTPAPPGAPNVLLIVLDNVRADSFSLYGHDRPTTPNLERLARRGVRFAQARSTAPWTLPSHASMFTGQWCNKLSVAHDLPLNAEHPTLAGYLAGRGYATAGFVGNVFYCNRVYGLDRGFAHYEDYYENERITPLEVLRGASLGRLVLESSGVSVRVEEGGQGERKTAERLNRDVLRWLDGRPRDRPFFVFLNEFDAHSPFLPPEGPDPRFGLAALPLAERVEIMKKNQRRREGRLLPGDGAPDQIARDATAVSRDGYESSIAYLDRQVGALIDALDQRGLLSNTLVLVTSDHGEHFEEHGFHGHGISLYRRELHVPLLIFPPSGPPSRQVVSEPASLRDLAATVVDLLGLAADSPFPGRSLVRFWDENATDRDRAPAPILSEVEHQKRFAPDPAIPATLGPVKALVAEGKVYIRNSSGREEIYDLASDPLESRNLVGAADLHPPVDHFRRLLEQVLDEPGAPTATARAGSDGPIRR